jgi:hypothetical protein
MKAVVANVVITVAIALLCGCATEPPVAAPSFAGLAENACLPEAIVMTENLRKQGITARILIVNTASFNHAVVVFLFPLDKPLVWVWDADTKSMQVQADFARPEQVARAWFQENLRDETALKASYL